MAANWEHLHVDPGRILCAEQGKCPFYLPWSGPQIGGQFQRENVRCERLGDDHRCSKCFGIEPCGQFDYVCTSINNPDPDGGRKRVGILIPPQRKPQTNKRR